MIRSKCIIVVVLLVSCVSTPITKPVIVKDIANPQTVGVVITNAHIQNFANNYRIAMYFNGYSKVKYSVTAQNDLVIAFDKNVALTKKAQDHIDKLMSPCGQATVDQNKLILKCSKNIKVYPENDSNYIDLIVQVIE